MKAFSATDERSISGAVPKQEAARERPDQARLPRRVVVVAGIAIVLLLAPFIADQVADRPADRFGNELGGHKDRPVMVTGGIATPLVDEGSAEESSNADHGWQG
jgi:hypothetical protein